MDTTTQLPLPKFREVEKVEPKRKIPQPRVAEFRSIKKFELLHRPFDLGFRGLINKWLIYLRDERGFELSKILSEGEYRLMSIYFYPQEPEGRWFNQDQVLEKISLKSKKKLRAEFVSVLVKIWTRTKKL